MLDIVTVSGRRDLALLAVQLRSFDRYAARSGFGCYNLVWNEPGTVPEELSNRVASAADPGRFRIWTSRELGIMDDALIADGWTTQQVAKLLISRQIKSPFYLVLDAKNFFVRAVSEGTFVGTDGKAFAHFENLAANASYRFCLEYFGVPNTATSLQGIRNVTPFVFHTRTAVGLADALVETEGCELADVFLRYHGDMSEFFVYQAFLSSRGRELEDYYAPQPSQANTLWIDQLHSSTGFDDWISRTASSDVPLSGLHWAAAAHLTRRQRSRVGRLWLDLGLVDSVDEGEAVIRRTYSHLNRGDREFLRQRLASSPSPEVSVVVSVCDNGSHVRKCLESILSQSAVSLEVICVNDASTDESLSILLDFESHYDNVRVVTNDTRQGPGASRQIGRELARGTDVQFVDAVSVLPPGSLARRLRG